jgi:hypothetical protein
VRPDEGPEWHRLGVNRDMGRGPAASAMLVARQVAPLAHCFLVVHTAPCSAGLLHCVLGCVRVHLHLPESTFTSRRVQELEPRPLPVRNATPPVATPNGLELMTMAVSLHLRVAAVVLAVLRLTVAQQCCMFVAVGPMREALQELH